MNKKTILYYSPATTDTFVHIIDDMTYEHMYLCRLEIAYKYAQHRFRHHSLDWNTKGFWNWFLRIWENNDKAILATMAKYKSSTISEAVYLSYQEVYFNRYIPSWWNRYDEYVDKKLSNSKI